MYLNTSAVYAIRLTQPNSFEKLSFKNNLFYEEKGNAS